MLNLFGREILMTDKQYRYATREDIPVILGFIKSLAHFEMLDHEVIATPELIDEWLFNRKVAEVIFAVTPEGQEAGMALFFHSFSTFLGRGGIWLEDLFVLPEYRSLGYGKFLLKCLANIAVERGCGRLELSCLDWNENAIKFYTGLGGKMMDDWTTYRFTGDSLKRLARFD